MVHGRHIAVALSGGGHRAALFGLGALLYLADSEKGRELSAISSVSGGSIANGYVGKQLDLTTATSTEMWDTTKQLASTLASRGTIWSSPVTWAYLASMGILIAAAVVVSTLATGPVVAVTWVVAIIVVGLLAQQRSRVAAHVFNQAIFQKSALSAVDRPIAHVLCSTDIQTAESVYFAGRFVYSWRLGWGVPGDLSLARAVQASAALPGAFNVVSLGIGRHHFAAPGPITRFKLSDGGVYDNMGTEWPIRLNRRLQDPGVPSGVGVAPIDQVVVVNASAGRGVVKQPLVGIPVLGEIMSLLAVKDVLYDQTTAVRRRYLDLRFRAARGALDVPDGELAGAMVQIDRSPFDLPDQFRDGHDDLADRANAAIACVGPANRDQWGAEAAANRAVKTKLSKIPPDRAASLIKHAYVLTMVNCHVLLGYPLVPIPNDTAFMELVK